MQLFNAPHNKARASHSSSFRGPSLSLTEVLVHLFEEIRMRYVHAQSDAQGGFACMGHEVLHFFKQVPSKILDRHVPWQGVIVKENQLIICAYVMHQVIQVCYMTCFVSLPSLFNVLSKQAVCENYIPDSIKPGNNSAVWRFCFFYSSRVVHG